jgi:hypothetical protein
MLCLIAFSSFVPIADVAKNCTVARPHSNHVTKSLLDLGYPHA